MRSRAGHGCCLVRIALPSLGLCQGLLDVADQIIDVFDAD
jgi:hypothetical protein